MVSVVGDDPAVDLVAVYALSEPDSLDLVAALSRLDGLRPYCGRRRRFRRETSARSGQGCTSAGSQSVRVRRALAHAVRALVDDAAHWLTGVVRPTSRRRLAVVPTGPWDEDQAKSLLDSLGIRTPARVAATRADEAHAALDRLVVRWR